jgi:hypothetical protein
VGSIRVAGTPGMLRQADEPTKVTPDSFGQKDTGTACFQESLRPKGKNCSLQAITMVIAVSLREDSRR